VAARVCRIPDVSDKTIFHAKGWYTHAGSRINFQGARGKEGKGGRRKEKERGFPLSKYNALLFQQGLS